MGMTEVMIPSPSPSPSPAADDSCSTTPCITAPSSPQRSANFFYSAPTSPNRVYHGDAALSAVPFNWEEKPGISKYHISTATSSNYGDAEDDLQDTDFAFYFSGQLEKDSLPADELFERGKIKPLKPPPRFQYNQNKPLDSPKRTISKAFSPRTRAKNPDFDPFTEALEQTRKESIPENGRRELRGRERSIDSSTTPNPRNKSCRSLSPFRVSDLLFDPENSKKPSSSSSWYKKWKIKDLLLFRSASESRAKDKEQQVKKSREDDGTYSVGSASSSGGSISAHEMHYATNRAFSEEMRKRTFITWRVKISD